MTLDALRAHYDAVADASPIPVLIYNVPVYMGYDIPDAWFKTLAGHPNIRGLKDSSGRTARLPGLRGDLGPAFVLLAGAGEKMIDAPGWASHIRFVNPTGIVDLMTTVAEGFMANTSAMTDSTEPVLK